MWGKCVKIQQIHECVNIMQENEIENLKKSKLFYYFILLTQKVGFIIFYIFHHIFVRLEIRGKENLKNIKGPVIFASNHTSELDVTLMPQIIGLFSRFYPIYFTTNAGDKSVESRNFALKNNKLVGKLFNVLGRVALYSGFSDYSVSLKNHVDLLKQGHTVCIFPEGRITHDGKIGETRGGLAYLVFATGATVIPIAIDSFFEMSAWDYFTFRRKVIVTICEPMYKSDLIDIPDPDLDEYREGSKRVLNRIQEVLEK